MRHVPAAHVLAVLPGGADVALHEPLIPAVCDGLADDAAALRVRHPAVDDVDALGVGVADQFDGVGLVVALQPLAAKAHLAHLQIRPAKAPVDHVGIPLLVYTCILYDMDQ